MKESLLIQFCHNCIDTTCFIQVFHISRTCRCKVTEIWCLFTDSICEINLKVHSHFMCDCRKMKHTVCRASKCHINSKCIQNCFFCHNISWADILLKKFHDFHTCMFCKTDSFWIYCRDCPVSAKSHTKYLCQTVHAVCCVHTRTWSACRTYFILEFTQVCIWHCSGRIRSYRLKHTGKTSLLSFYMSCKHRSATDKYSRYINSCCSHQKSRYILITVRDHN